MQRRISIFAAVVAVALAALVAIAMATGAGSGRRVHVVTTAKSTTLRMTCHPLVVGAHDTPVGTSRLGTVERPGGRRQVTYRGGGGYGGYGY